MKLYVFLTLPLSIIMSFSLYTQQWYMSYSLRAGSGRNWSLIRVYIHVYYTMEKYKNLKV